MPKKLTLSIVVPVYNEAAVLPFCLDNLLEQIDDIFEIVIVDNNSTDGSLELAREYASEWSKIRVVSEKAQGLVPARDRGFLAARGDIIGRIDADTRVATGWALAVSSYFANNKRASALAGQTRYYDLPLEGLTARISSLIVDDVNKAIMSGSNFLYGPNMALRAGVAKALARASCDEHGQLNEDLDLTIHIVDRGGFIGRTPDMLAYISGRRLKMSPVSFVPYCLNWPRTYRLHQLWSAAMLAYLLTIIYCLGQAIVFLPLRAYDHEKLEFSWRRLVAFDDNRIIP